LINDLDHISEGMSIYL